jgi:DNA-binding Lrp family transcriptional regulator
VKEEQLNTLKLMSQVTSRMDLNEFAQKVSLDPTEAMANVQELTRKGLVRKGGSGYGLTEKGKAALKAFTPVPEDKSFQFYTQLGYPTVYSAQSLADFYSITRQISQDSLEFHLIRGDFEKWANDVLSDCELAEKIENIKKTNPKNDAIRTELLKSIDQKYDLKDLL